MGRVTTFTEKIAEQICNRISEGEPLRQICREKGMPAWRTVYHWIKDNKDFAAHIACAREIGFDAIAEEALEIANTPLEGQRVETSKEGKKVVREDMLGHRKLQIETRLKLLAKWSPSKYGERQAIDLNGNLAIHDMTDAEIKAEIATLTGAKLDHEAEPE